MRISIFGVGALATIMAIAVGSIYELFVLCSDFVYVMLFPQMLCVIFFFSVNTYGSVTGYFVGLFFRIAGGEHTLGMPPLIKYPWYDEKEQIQLFPFKTFGMLTTCFCLFFFVSFITNFVFKHNILPKKYDLARCVVNFTEEKDSKQKPPMDLSKTVDQKNIPSKQASGVMVKNVLKRSL